MTVKWWVALALLAAGCKSSGDSLVVVTVDARPALANVAVLHTSSTAGMMTIEHDLGGGQTPFSIGAGATKSFGVQVPSSITGAFSIHVEARNAAGAILGVGNGATTLSPGHREDLSIVLGGTMVDGGADAGGDGMLTPIVSEAIYVASGGSPPASGAQQLNVSVGGTDTVGVSSAPSGAQLASGFFASQLP
jgi:hypothetical protein